MKGIVQMYRYFSILSIDVALGAVCSALFFAELLSVKVLPVGLITLGLTVWIIYSVDHLLDARKIKSSASTERHRFHQKHFRALAIIVAITIFVNAILIFFIRRPVFFGGVLLAIIVFGYLILHSVVKFPKEILIAILYVGGVLLPSISVTSIPMATWPWILIVQFFITALLNLVIFSWYDQPHDRSDGNRSIALHLGEQNTQRLIWILLSVNLILFIPGPWNHYSVIVLLMNAILFTVFVNRKNLATNDTYRFYGDAIFFLPLTILWL
jgi:hypothetical protein